MKTPDTAALRAAALAASQQYETMELIGERMIAMWAIATPAAILALLDELDRLRASQPRPRPPLDPAIMAALDKAAKVHALHAELPDGSIMFINYGEQDFPDFDPCPTCGGSGEINHRDRPATAPAHDSEGAT